MVPKVVHAAEDIQLADPEFWKLPWDEREGAFETLRRERPLSFQPELDDRMFPLGAGFWALTRYKDILEVSKNHDTFCSGQGSTSIADIPIEFLEFYGSMINMDDPKHNRLRGLISGGFTPKRLKKVAEDVQRTAVKVIDSVIEKGECDFVTEVAAQFPLKIICDMMGIPDSQYEFVFKTTNVILGGGDPEYVPEDADLAQVLMQAGADLVELMKDLRKERLENPTDDLTSILAHADVDGDRLSDQEIGSFFILLATAGNETTRNAISIGMEALHNNPDQRALWTDDFEGLAPGAIEEIVRWATPVIFMRRTATRDTVLSGEKIKEGDKLIMWYNSANRDEDVFENPYTFDIQRHPNDHVGFGGPGRHFCLGANLARREITTMFRQIFSRMPDLELTAEPESLLSFFIHGRKHMPCKFTPGVPSSN